MILQHKCFRFFILKFVLIGTLSGLGGRCYAQAATLPVSPTIDSAAPLAPTQPSPGVGVRNVPFLESFPHLKNYVYIEPRSGFFLGLGVSPIGILKDRTVFTANFFQIHYFSERWDFEIFNAAYGITRAESSTYQSNNFTLRSTLKMKIGKYFSLGPLIGYEFISFPNLGATLLKLPYQSPNEPFSSRGLIYGGMLSQTFQFKEEYLIQINELAYQETYSNTKTPEGWNFQFNDPNVQGNPGLIGASFVSMIEVSFLF